MIKIKHYFILLCIASTSFYSLKSQVTIGIDANPVSGALLDLKQESVSGGEANAKKGLGLPRVNLTDWNNLYPMFSADPDYIDNIGGKKDKYDEEHIGLVVYNVNNCLNAVTSAGAGIYVWNGKKWNALTKDFISLSSGVQAHKDQDGNTFYSGDFGPAGRWMLYNLRVKKYADGTPLPADPDPILSFDSPKWAYPEPDGGDGTNGKWVNDFEPLGLLYNGHAAFRGFKLAGTINQGQIAGDAPGPNEVETIGPDGPDAKGNRYVQGICPDGWHIPSDRSWNKLEKEIYNSRQEYSNYTSTDVAFSPATWSTSFETNTPYPPHWDRGSSSSTGHNYAMIAPCQTSYKQNELKSKPSIEGGFYVILAGRFIYSGGINTYLFGQEGYIRSSSFNRSNADPDPPSYCRGFNHNTPKVNRSGLLYTGYTSVRCKMNGT